MKRVAIVGGARTPFVKALGVYKDVPAIDLSTHTIDGALDKLDLDPTTVEELHFGLVVINPRMPNFTREVVIHSKLPMTTRAVTYTDACITGTTAIAALHDAIALGRVEVGLAGGVESMSNATIMYSENASAALRDASAGKSMGDKLAALARIRPKDLIPTPPGVTEPSTGLTMGEHCELMVKEWGVSREFQDQVAYESHMNAAKAWEDGRLAADVVPFRGVDKDNMVRSGTTLEKLAKLKPVFDPTPSGTLTAGNSSPLTDGASVTCLMSASRARKEKREVLAYIKDFENASIDPKDGLLMAPGVAVPRLLKRNGLTWDDIGLVEIHEAFGGQVGCNIAAWEKGWKEDAIGAPDMAKVNTTGGSLAIGHPFAATGSRIVNQLAAEMARTNTRYGLISICAAGAQAAAMLLERDV